MKPNLELRHHRAMVVVVVLCLLMGLTLLLRAWDLNRTPPGLWWDEATQGTDAWDLLHGQFRVFFRAAEGKEPLYIYLTTPFVAAWNGQPFAVRLAGAVLGALMIPILYIAARSLWRKDPPAGVWVGLTAAGLWAVNFWPQSLNRIGFQVNAFPLVMTLAVTAWVNWAYGRATRQRAMVFGFLAGLTLATYLAARITPVLWVCLFFALPKDRRHALWPDLGWAFLGFSLIALPLAVHFLLNPQDISERVGSFPLLRGELAGRTMWEGLWYAISAVSGSFLGWSGDPVLRHNIPNHPAFSPVSAALVAVGLGAAILSLRRRSDPRGWTLLLWLLILSLPSLLSLNSNPHFPRLFGALPAALLLAAWPVGSTIGYLGKHRSWLRLPVALGIAVLITAEGMRTIQAYFVTWRQMDLYEAYQLDFSLLGDYIRANPDAVAIVPMNTEASAILEYRLRDEDVRQVQVDEHTIGGWLADELQTEGGEEVIVPVWNEGPHVYADPRLVVPFYMNREGVQVAEQKARALDIWEFRLGDDPAFDAPGSSVSLDVEFSPAIQLVGARWGAAYPNADRNSTRVAAGTPVWMVLDWRLQEPLSNLRASVDVLDSTGHRLNSSDQNIMPVDPGPDERPMPAIVRTYHLVEVPVTEPPGTVALAVRLYDSGSLTPLWPAGGTPAGGVIISRAMVDKPLSPPDVTVGNLGKSLQADLPDGVRLLSVEGDGQTVAPGTQLTLRLVWQVNAIPEGERVFRVSLGGTDVFTQTVVPVNASVDYPIHTYVDLRLPAGIERGTYPLVLSPEGLHGSDVELGQVEVQGRARRFDAPPSIVPARAVFGDIAQLSSGGGSIELLGTAGQLDNCGEAGATQISAGQPISLTLAWRVQSTPTTDLVRFVHLLDGQDGPPLAQMDSRPCSDACPAGSWLPGEVLLDPVQLPLPAELPAGQYRLAVGWYDAATLERLPVLDDEGQRRPDSMLVLPVCPVVTRD